jgi:lipoprotein NlpD
MMLFKNQLACALAVNLAALLMLGCSSTRLNHAPVEDRGTRFGASGMIAPAVKLPLGFENAGNPGYYTVKPGDTLIRIAMEHGQSLRDIAHWSQVSDPNRIEVGQVLRVVPPVNTQVQIKPVTGPVVIASSTKPAASSAARGAISAASPPTTSTAPAAEIHWMWPASGEVLAGFDEIKNKGLDIDGKAGAPVVAAADGRVVYVGAGLRGYGNLIILKHDNVFLTAYAHNQTLLVKEDQSVLKGQKIAVMGNSDADRVKLHFELRRQGKPVDPLKYLPAR